MPAPPPPKSPPPAGQRIAKLLARAGIASRREVERMIADGRVAIGGVAIDTPATLLGSLHGVTVDGAPVEAAAPARLFLYHKPPGLLVTERDPAGRPTIYDRLPSGLPRLVPVGRLDLNTEGLLLLTTDGELKRQLELPSTGVERAYRARAYGAVTQARLEDLIEGVEIEGVRYGSIDANLERRTGANVWIEMILTEGKNREVRRVLEYLGLQVSRLIRTRYGPFVLGDLPPGQIGEVRQHDVVAFRKDPTRNPPPERAEPQGRDRARAAPRPTPVTIASRRDARSASPVRDPLTRAARPAGGAPGRKPAAPRIDRAAASAADRAAFADARPPRPARASRPRAEDGGWSPRDSRPAEERAARPATPGAIRPKRFYDAKPPRDRAAPGAARTERVAPSEAGPTRVFNPELQRNVRAKRPAPPRDGSEKPARPARAGPSSRATAPRAGKKPGGTKPGDAPRPPRTRK